MNLRHEAGGTCPVTGKPIPGEFQPTWSSDDGPYTRCLGCDSAGPGGFGSIANYLHHLDDVR